MIDELLALADELSRRADVVARRRAISTAYYAAFHALCDLIAGSLVEEQNSPLFEKIYRHLDHKHLDKDIIFAIEGADPKEFDAIRIGLRNLRQLREAADYAPYGSDEVFDDASYLTNTREVVQKIKKIDPVKRRHLALNILIGGGKARLSATYRPPSRTKSEMK